MGESELVEIPWNERIFLDSVCRPVEGDVCHLVVFPDGIAWRPASSQFFPTPIFMWPSEYYVIPRSAIHEVRLKYVRSNGSLIHIAWQGDSAEPNIVEFQVRFPRLLLSKLSLIGISVVGMELFDWRTLRGLINRYGIWTWFAILTLAAFATLFLSDRQNLERNLLFCSLVAHITGVIGLVFFSWWRSNDDSNEQGTFP